MPHSRLRTCCAAAAALALLPAHLAYGQRLVHVEPKILKQHRDEYTQAMEEWQNGDKTLERDLHAADRQSLIERIDKEAARTAKFLESKRTYFSSLRSFYQEQYITLEGAVGANSKPPQSKEEIQEHIDSVGRERADLDDRIRAAKEVDIRQKLMMQHAALKVIQDSLLEQKAIVDRWERAETGIAESRKAMLASLRRMTDVLAAQESGVAEIKEQSERLFAAMRTTAGPIVKTNPPPPPPPPPTKDDPKPVSSPAPEPPKPQPVTATIGGKWRFNGAPGEPLHPGFLVVDVKVKGALIEGTFEAGDPLPEAFKGAKIPSRKPVSFTGSATQTKFSWESGGGRKGTIELSPVTDTRLKVTLKLINAESVFFMNDLGRVD